METGIAVVAYCPAPIKPTNYWVPADTLLEDWIMSEGADFPFRLRLASMMLAKWGLQTSKVDENVYQAKACLEEADKIITAIQQAEKEFNAISR